MRSNMSAFDRSDKSIGKYETRLTGLNKKLEVQKRVTEQARKQYEKMVEENKLGTIEGEKAAREYHNQAAALKNLERYVGRTTDELEKLRKEQAYQESGWGKLSTNLSDFSGKMNKAGESLTNIGHNMSMKVTAPVVGLGTAAVVAGMNFEEGMSKVQAISGATGEELDQLEAMAKDMGENTRFSATQAAEGMSFLAMAGYDTNQILSSMPGLLDLAASGQLDLGRAADIASNVMSGFNLEAEDTGKIADVLAKSAASANTSVEQMGGAMSYVAPVAAGAGIAMEETAAAIGILSNAGIQGERAGTTLRSMIASLQNPTGQTAKALEDLGLSAEQVNPSAHSLSEILKTLEKSGMDSSQAMQLVGVEAGPGLIAMLSEGSKGLNDFTKDLENSEGSASEMAKTMEDNTKGSLREFQSALEGAGIAVSEHLLPPLTDIITKGTELVKKFGELDKGTQKTIITTVGLAAAIGPLSLVLGSTFKVVGTLSGGLSKLAGWIGRTSINSRKASKSLDLLGNSAKVNNLSIDTFGKSVNNVGKSSKKSRGLLRGFGKTANSTGKGASKLTGLVGKAGGAFSKLGGVTKIAAGGLRFLGGPMGLLASFAIPELIKGGVGLVNHLRDDSIPAITDFGDNVSEATTEAVLGYKSLNDEATAQLNQLMWSSQEITPEISKQLTDTFGEMGEQIKTSLKEDFDESYQSLSSFLSNSKSLSDKEQQAILDNMKTKQKEQQKSVNDSEARIKEIMDKASKEKRSLTEAEKNEINRIQDEMMNTAVKTMSNGEVEQKAILESLRSESKNITSRQAAETVKNSLEAKKGTVKEAKEKYDEVVAATIRERDETGSITAEQADKIIKEAEKQRDESIKNAEDMHNGVVKQAKKQAKGQVDEIDWATGEVLSNWDKMIRGVAKAVNKVTGGINWVLDKIGVKEIPEWKPKGYAIGTPSDGHPGGAAIVGEKGRELAYIPGQGVTLLGTKGPELHPNLPKGTAVLPNKQTEQMLKSYGFPGYENGIGDFFSWVVEGPKRLMSKVWDKFKPEFPNVGVGGALTDMGNGIVSYLKDKSLTFIKNKLDGFLSFDGGSVSAPTGKGVSRWKNVILQAAAVMGEKITGAELNGILAQIQRESGGNEKIIQSSAVWDVNTAAGNPARGLLQYIPQTFAAYKVPGHGNIYSGYDQLLAFFNNKTWRRDLPYGRRGWGPRGGRKFATGGLVNEGLYHLGEEGWPEWIIPTAPNRRTEAMKLLALAGKEIQGNKRPNQLPSVGGGSGGSDDNRYLETVVDKLTKQVQLLTELVISNRQIANKPVLSEGDIGRSFNRYDAKQASKHAIFNGKGAY